MLRLEKEMLGQFVTDHPLLPIRDALASQCDCEMIGLPDKGDGDVVVVGGIIGSIGRKYTKKGDPYALFRLEDLAGGVGVVAFPSVYEKVADMLQVDEIVLVKGRIDLRGRELQLAALEIRRPDLSSVEGLVRVPEVVKDPLVVDVPAVSCTDAMLGKLKSLLASAPGRVPVVVRVVHSQGVTPLRLGDGYRVEPTTNLLSELRLLVGPEAVRLEAVPVANGNGHGSGHPSTLPAVRAARRPSR
jgi:DNA polymerase-3 subunit alpha